MKKERIIGIVITVVAVLLIIIAACFAFGVFKGKSEEKNNASEEKSNLSDIVSEGSKVLTGETKYIGDISFIGNGYAFVSEGINHHWKLYDLKGNQIFELPDNYIPKSKVINGYFLAGRTVEGSGNQNYDGLLDGKLYKADGTEPFEGSEITAYIGFEGKKITTDNYSYLVKTKKETKDFDGTHKEEHVYNISQNLEECTDDVSWKNIIDGSGKYSLTYRFMYADYDDVYNPGFQVDPKETRFLDVYVKQNNGYFTHMKDDEKLYEPIEGKIYKNNGSTTDVLAKIDDKLYIVKENGDKKEIDYIPDDYEVKSFYDGYIVASSGMNSCLFDPDGNKIEFKL